MLNQHFEFGRRLGIGATAEVYLAYTLPARDPRALKIFTPLVKSDPETVRRIQVEMETLQSLNHANIVRLFRSHAYGDELALELEFVDGSDLRAWREGYRLAINEPLLWILCQIASGLGCAHENGVMHRDLKPENVLVGANGDVKLSDFGLARQLDSVTMTKSGLLTGSIGYMAPEILDGQRPTPKSDVFSFGAVAYELLSGKNPFWGPNPQAALKNLLTGKLRPLADSVAGVCPAVLKVIEQCLALDPNARPLSIWHVEAELRHALGNSNLRGLRALVSLSGREAAMVPAFEEKSKEFERRKAELAAMNKTASSEQWLRLARDWSYTFPNSKEPSAILVALSANKKSYKRESALALLLLLLGAGWLLWPKKAPVAAVDEIFVQAAAPTPPPPAENPAPAPAPAPVKEQPKAALVSGSAPRASGSAPLTMGYINVDADPDVQIFVDEQEVDPLQWHKIPAKPGRRRLKMFKEGFLPIENLIQVRAGQVAVVKARGTQ